jgi:hypothetical protein
MQGQESVDALIAAIEAGGGTGLAKLRAMIRGYAAGMTSDFGASQVRVDIRDLTEKNGKIVRAARKRTDLTLRGYIIEGVTDGSVSPCDAKLTAFAIAGALNWIGQWYEPGGALSTQAIADEFVVRLTEGLTRTQPSNKTPSAHNKDPRSSSRR